MKTDAPLSSEQPMVDGRMRRVCEATDAGRPPMKEDRQALREPDRKVLGADAPQETATDRHRSAYNGLKVLSRLRERGYRPGHLPTAQETDVDGGVVRKWPAERAWNAGRPTAPATVTVEAVISLADRSSTFVHLLRGTYQ
ncbi:hypothetical protein [Streptomyces adustus]